MYSVRIQIWVARRCACLLQTDSCFNFFVPKFLEFKIVTDSDVLPLLFAIDDAFEIEITSDDNKTFKMEFKEPMLNYFLRDWQSIKQLSEIGGVSPEDYALWKKMRSSYTKVTR